MALEMVFSFVVRTLESSVSWRSLIYHKCRRLQQTHRPIECEPPVDWNHAGKEN